MDSLPIPGPIPTHTRENFNTLRRAFSGDDVAIVSAIRKRDNAPVYLICAMQWNEDQTITPVPFAEMCEGNPFEDYYDPTIIKEET